MIATVQRIMRSRLALAAVAVGVAGFVGWSMKLILAVLGLLICPGCGRSDVRARSFPAVDPGTPFSAGIDRARYDELVGASGKKFEPRERCSVGWLDEDGVLTRGDGPKNGSRAIGWFSYTTHGKPVTGRYSMDVWRGTAPGTGAFGFGSAFTKVENIRLRERLRPPAPAPRGWTAILPGQCVLGSLRGDASRVVGRYWVELPANRTIRVRTFVTISSAVHLAHRLTLADVEIPSAEADTDRHPTSEAGYYGVTVLRTDEADAGPALDRGAYTLNVRWGEPASEDCFPPEPNEAHCF